VRGFSPEQGLLIEQRGHFKVGTRAEIIGPRSGPLALTIERITDSATLLPLEAARHAQQLVYVPSSEAVEEYSIVRTA